MPLMAETYENLDDSYEGSLDTEFDELEDLPDEDQEDYESERFRSSWPRSRSPLVRTTTPMGGGVSRAMLRTPRGYATVQLSEHVVSQRLFDATVTTLRTGINRNTDRTNALQRDITGLAGRITATAARGDRQRKELQKLRTDTTKWQRQNTAALAKARREQQNSMMMTLLVILLINGGIGGNTGTGSHNNDNLVLLLLLMPMMGGYGGDAGSGGMGDSNNMMWLILALTLTGNLGNRPGS